VPVEVLDVGAEDLDPPFLRFEQLPGAGGRVSASLDETAQVDAKSLQLLTMNPSESEPTAAKCPR